MEFVFKPEKLSDDLIYQISECIAKRAENFSRTKYPGMWKKVDSLSEHKMPEDVLRRRKIRHTIYGVFLIAVGIFLFIPGLMKPKELTVPLIVGAFSIINGIFAVLPRRKPEERYKRKAKKLADAINSSIKPGDMVVFGDEAIFENGALLMEYQNLEPLIESRSLWLVCDGAKVMVLRKTDLVSGSPEEFFGFINKKQKNKD